jgi:hypothetical protein
MPARPSLLCEEENDENGDRERESIWQETRHSDDEHDCKDQVDIPRDPGIADSELSEREQFPNFIPKERLCCDPCVVGWP